MGSHVADLEAKINELGVGLRGVGDVSLSEELSTLIHRPGWTTVAEAQLVKAMIDTMQAHTRGAQTLRQALLAGTRQVGATEMAAVT